MLAIIKSFLSLIHTLSLSFSTLLPSARSLSLSNFLSLSFFSQLGLGFVVASFHRRAPVRAPKDPNFRRVLSLGGTARVTRHRPGSTKELRISVDHAVTVLATGRPSSRDEIPKPLVLEQSKVTRISPTSRDPHALLVPDRLSSSSSSLLLLPPPPPNTRARLTRFRVSSLVLRLTRSRCPERRRYNAVDLISKRLRSERQRSHDRLPDRGTCARARPPRFDSI